MDGIAEVAASAGGAAGAMGGGLETAAKVAEVGATNGLAVAEGGSALIPDAAVDLAANLAPMLDTDPLAGIHQVADLPDVDSSSIIDVPASDGSLDAQVRETAAPVTDTLGKHGVTGDDQVDIGEKPGEGVDTVPATETISNTDNAGETINTEADVTDEVPTHPETDAKLDEFKALDKKVKNGTASREDLLRHRELMQDPEQLHQRQQELIDKAGTAEGLSDAEVDELADLNTRVGLSEKTELLTPTQEAEELMKREGLGTSTEEGLAGLSTEQRQQIQEAFEKMFKDVDKAREQDAEREREMKRLQGEIKKLREQNKRLADQVKKLNGRLDAAGVTQKQVLGVTV